MTGARLAPLPTDQWGDEERDLLRGNLPRAERYLSGEPDAPPMPAILGLFARHPGIGGPWLSFSGKLLDEGTIDARDRELVILRTGWRTQCGYQWAQHVGMARAAGLTATEIEAVPRDLDAAQWNDRDNALLEAVDQLIDTQRLTDETWARLAEHFDERQLLELLFLIGSYLCLALVLNGAGLLPTSGPALPVDH
jgi:4-carboxymuconolactone decarboxylase